MSPIWLFAAFWNCFFVLIWAVYCFRRIEIKNLHHPRIFQVLLFDSIICSCRNCCWWFFYWFSFHLDLQNILVEGHFMMNCWNRFLACFLSFYWAWSTYHYFFDQTLYHYPPLVFWALGMFSHWREDETLKIEAIVNSRS